MTVIDRPTFDIEWMRAYRHSEDDITDYIDEVKGQDISKRLYHASKDFIDENPKAAKVIVKAEVIGFSPDSVKAKTDRVIDIHSLDKLSHQRTSVNILNEERHGALFDREGIDNMLNGTPAEDVAASKKYRVYKIRSI